MLIDINTLNSNILSKIPLSIRLNLNGNILDTDSLPLEVAYELRNISSPEITETYVNKSTFDLRPEFSVYTDFKSLDTKKDTIIEYIKNYLIVDRGAFPFDPSFGTYIKYYLQALDSEPAQISINQELVSLANIIQFAFKIPVSISNMGLRQIENDVASYYELKIKVNIDDTTTILNFEKQIDNYYLM